MRILYVVPYVPSLIRVRPFNLIRALHDLAHEVTVITPWTGEEERKAVERLRQHARRVVPIALSRWRSLANCLAALPTRTPLQASYSWTPNLIAAARDLLVDPPDGGTYDVIHAEHLRGARYGLALREFRRNGEAERAIRTPVVWDSVDCISHLFRQSAAHNRQGLSRWITRFELGRTSTYEAWLIRQFDRVLVTSEVDKAALESLTNGRSTAAPISVLPNGVDLTYFTPPEGPTAEREHLVITGKMSYHANVNMCLHTVQEIMPRIWAQRPDVRLVIVGKDPTREIRSLGDHPNVEVTGTVPDIRPYLRRAAIALAPITYGAGIQNKVLEAMACATPVLCSPRAVAAVDARPGTDLLVAGDAEGFARETLDLLADDHKRERIGQAGRTYVEAHHSWKEIGTRLAAIYSTLTGVGRTQDHVIGSIGTD